MPPSAAHYHNFQQMPMIQSSSIAKTDSRGSALLYIAGSHAHPRLAPAAQHAGGRHGTENYSFSARQRRARETRHLAICSDARLRMRERRVKGAPASAILYIGERDAQRYLPISRAPARRPAGALWPALRAASGGFGPIVDLRAAPASLGYSSAAGIRAN